MNIANKLTLARMIAIPFFIVSMYVFQTFEIAALIFVLASITDWLDGYLARKYHLITNFGKFADPLADKILVLTAFILLVEKHYIPAWIVCIIVCRELAITGLRLLLVEQGKVMAADWSGKIKTATQMFAIIFLLMNNFHVGNIFLYICLFFTIYSGIEYFYKNRSVFENLSS
ncbi:CDP-diacylglycerol--glycerol-3-phosphate 3-phosphatidyltransferase [Carnobacteriaceae bacterium zg-84]|uniref:CDP-diacylglycerol--glycerol-3-phosphate 3-phosphatidyltransferase n=1 Tax=Granulicatella sp. zg-84 TaxID=2678503 RepID=UPI0013C18827|nr:CDP-diacylglycerol--glycerol-3-phosphate 3-phosphatidyltransferase [Granulicatella sp. zg-84]NEW65750.1 CDP-diacylglycerol--glycerol-3-phosphate 3-phosphatidyltransferase [Granulicatella sp. zg-84]QMI86498.1 CDP-diacylglycerol--glycerol-3-phosphate 3-phosphatidyltransferase [Carnobacteriaceae bacterium zg-84]